MSLKAKVENDRKWRLRFKEESRRTLREMEKSLAEGRWEVDSKVKVGLVAWENPKKRGFAPLVNPCKKAEKQVSGIRIRNRCGVSGRARSVIRRYGAGRMNVRMAARKGWRPGVQKASW